MHINTKNGILYLHSCFQFANISEKSFIKKLMRFLFSRHKVGVRSIAVSALYAFVIQLNLISGKIGIRLVWRLARSLNKTGWRDTLEYRHFKRKASSPSKSSVQASSVIPSPEVFKSSIRNLFIRNKQVLALGLLIMAVTGRRKKDIVRLEANSLVQLDSHKFSARIPHDKTHSGVQFFIIDFGILPQAWSIANPSSLAEALLAVAQVSSSPFKGLDSSNLVRTVGFRPHSLRSLAAVFRTWAGWSDCRIMEDLGWASRASLVRYRALTVEVIRSAESVRQAVEWLRAGSEI